MKNIDMLGKKQNFSAQIDTIKTWHKFNADKLAASPEDEKFYYFFIWLASEYTEPLADCPFHCEECSRKVSIESKDYDNKSFYTIVAADPNMQFQCVLSGLYGTESKAREEWNKIVKGE